MLCVDARRGEKPLSLRILRLIPAVGNLIATEELSHVGRARRPSVTNDLRLGNRPVVDGVPGAEQVVEHRIELLLRWVPRL